MNKEQLIYLLKTKKIVCFGSGDSSENFLNQLPLLEIEFFLDNDLTKNNTEFRNRKVIHPTNLKKDEWNKYFIIICSMYSNEIKGDLIYYGLNESINYIDSIDLKRILNLNSLFPNGHFYSPIPEIDILSENNATQCLENNELQGVELNVERQNALLKEIMPILNDFKEMVYGNEMLRYNPNNHYFGLLDSAVLFAMLHKLRPKRIIEIGSGYSSAVMLDAKDILDLDSGLLFIDPNPERLMSLLQNNDLKKENIEIKTLPVQLVDIEEFKKLEENDVLFIDSSHVSKIGSDVNYLMFVILPLLKKGVIIHFHDLFFPFKYPETWINEGRYWNEAYLLRSFLQYNNSFTIEFWTDYLQKQHNNNSSKELQFFYSTTGASLWLKKIV